MKKIICILSSVLLLTIPSHAQVGWEKLKKKAESYSKGNSSENLSQEEVIRGLKEALEVGTENAVELTSGLNGFLGNREIRIPFPPEAKKVENTVRSLGMDDQVDAFIKNLNHAAEIAAKEATPIFTEAIKKLTIGDGWNILNGPDNAATAYLEDKTTVSLSAIFKPVVQRALDEVSITRYWDPIIKRYNQVPFVEKQNPDLAAYVTEGALKGLFIMIAKEEKKIRKDPLARVSDILEKVFGRK